MDDLNRKETDSGPMSDREAILLLRLGDENCFDTLFRGYYKPFCIYARRFVQMPQAEEIVQDAMMWLWENRSDLTSDTRIKPLLLTIIKNKCLNSISRDAIKNNVIEQLARNFNKKLEDADFYSIRDLMDMLDKTLEKLPPDFAQTFRMHRMEGMKYKEIAEKLNVSEQTVNYRIGKVVKFLREELRELWTILLFIGLLQR